MQYEIYNRWGQLIYLYSGGDSGWDGTYNEMPCAIGVYIYVVRYRDNISGAVFMLKGNATLIR
jgi:gliding motility-associated-like protein